ncbi:MAG: hypothetical protein EAX81_03950 [Candidatus Thorarchaeota archaeon]|nr:hypothetical protein [Candidatus Thorarchaeota archaeon]
MHGRHTRLVFSIDFFKEQLAKARESGINPAVTEELSRILTGGSAVLEEEGKEAPCLTSDDVKHLWERAVRRTKKVGAHVHRRITDMFDRFLNVQRAIRNDDRDSFGGGFRIVAEMPLGTELGKGRADLVVFRRETAPAGLRTLWRPVMVVEIKSRCGFKWYMVPERRSSLSRKRYGMVQRVVPRFRLSLRPLSPSEWEQVVDGIPEPNTVIQLDTYAEALSEAFGSIAHLDSPPRVIRATLVIDPTDENRKSRSMIQSFLLSALESCLTEDLSQSRTAYNVSRDGLRPRMALVVHSQEYSPNYGQPQVPQEWKPPYDPLIGAGTRARRFILYVSAASPTSAGLSAAWIARHHHGLQTIHEFREASPDLRVFWLDMANEFPTPTLAEARLRARGREAENSLSDAVKVTFRSIEFKQLFADIQTYLYSDGPMVDLSAVLGDQVKQPRMLVVSGWDIIDSSTPSPYRTRMNRLLAEIVDQLPDDEQTIILWLSRPVKYERRTPIYSTNCFIPVRDTSPLLGELDEIIWNLPCGPEQVIYPDSWQRPSTSKSPMFDDIRIVVAQSLQGFETSLIHIPALRHWSAKFRTEEYNHSKKEIPEPREHAVPGAGIRERIRSLALTLIPWLVDLWPDTHLSPDVNLSDSLRNSLDEIHDSAEGLTVTRRSLSREPTDVPSLLNRLQYRPPRTRGGKAFADIFLGQINAHRLYRARQQSKSKPRPSYPKTFEPPKLRIASFGQMVCSEDADQPLYIVALEDPENPARVLVGFLNSYVQIRTDGLQWAESRISEQVDDIQQVMSSGHRFSLALQQDDEGWLLWQKDSERSDWTFESTIDIIRGRTIGSTAMIRAIRYLPSSDSVTQYTSDIRFPANLTGRLDKAVARILKHIRQQKEVSVKLSWTDNGCTVDFKTGDDVLDTVEHLYTSNLVETLTLTRGGFPVNLSSGHLVVWDRFRDIDYGEVSLLIDVSQTFIPATTEIGLPAKLSDLLCLPEGEELEFQLSHERDECPLFSGQGEDHGRCWRLSLVGENEAVSRIFCGFLTDREVFLRIGSKSVVFGSKVYPIKVDVPSALQQEGMVFRESPLIRKILQRNGVRASPLKPGAYLQAAQQEWEISVTIRDDWLTWVAVSTLTGENWKNRAFTYELQVVRELSDILDELWGYIISEIPEKFIHNSELQKARLRGILEKRGLSDALLQVRLEATMKRRILTVEARRTGNGDEMIDSISWELPRRVKGDHLIDSIVQRLEEGTWARFDVVNKEEFFETLDRLLD